MKLRINKLKISNFKGIAGEFEISFADHATFLYGPNGYGKTTIFDALELALTGQVNRVKTGINEHGGKRHDSTVFHHDKNRDVIVKIEISNGDESVVVARKIPKLNEKYGTSEIWRLIQSYELNDFESAIEDSTSVSQSELETRIFGGSNSGYLERFFRLMMYMPQSDTVYFLRADQRERHQLLNPLLNMDEENQRYEKLKTFRTRLGLLVKNLEKSLEQYKANASTYSKEEIKYIPLFRKDGSEHELDEENPYKGYSSDRVLEKNRILSDEIEQLSVFLRTFKPKEFEKNTINNRLRKLLENENFLGSVVFSELSEAQRKNTINNARVAKAVASEPFKYKYVLSKVLEPKNFKLMERERKNYLKYKNAIFNEDNNLRSVHSMLEVLSSAESDFMLDTQQKANKHLQELVQIEESTEKDEKKLTEINGFREQLFEHLRSKQKATKRHVTDCPLCGFDWKTNEAVIEAIEEKTASIESKLSKNTKALQRAQSAAKKEFLDDIITRGREFLDEKQKQFEFFSSIREYGSISNDELEQFEKVSKRSANAKKLIVDSSDISGKYVENANMLARVFADEVGVFDESVNRIMKSTLDVSFDEEILFLKDKIKLSKPRVSIDNVARLSHSDLNIEIDKVINQIQKFIENNKVDFASIENHVMYSKYFGNSEKSFDAVKKGLQQKKKYLDQQYRNAQLQFMKDTQKRFEAISKLHDRIGALIAKIESSVKKYQFDITLPLRAPFYVFSARILQNSPYGQGVFIRTDGDRSTVVFSASRETTHDAKHQLSEGQLAVVSLAFHMAMNAVYTQKSSNMLIIDDPIQDMDAMNIHAFTELVRREFVTDYQIIISTHNDLEMQHMKFMFEKVVGTDGIHSINVQDTFYGVER